MCDVSNGGGGGVQRNEHDVSRGHNRYVRLHQNVAYVHI